MPNHWRPTRGRTAPRVKEDRATGQVEPSRRHHRTPQHAAATVNPTVQSEDVEKPRFKRSFSRTRTEIDRPRTAGGATQPTYTLEVRPPRGSSRAYTSEAQKQPTQRLDLKTTYCMDEEMIGMALGSPGHPPVVQSNIRDHLHDPMVDTGVQGYPEGMVEAKSNNTKAGKWKKFGGLFKPKHNVSVPAATPSPQLLQQQYTRQNIDITESKPLPPLKDIPRMGQTLAHSEQTPTDSPPIEDAEDSFAPIHRTQLPKLDVDIPDVQMDRYSVMFGSLLGDQQSKNLLSRRSKVLEKLKTTSDENDVLQDPLLQREQPENAGLATHVAGSQDDEHLKPPPSSRRATSPAPGKSPQFSLFPQPPTTPRRAAAMTSQSKPSPLRRSFTAPSRLSPPMEEAFGSKTPQTVKPNYTKRRKSSISLVETSASTAQGPGWSTDGSFLSPSSSVSSVGDEILFDIKKLSMVTENQEPQYEVTKPDGETVELYRARSQKIRATKPPALKLSSKFAAAEVAKPLTPKANDTILSSSNATANSTREGLNNVPAISESSTSGYLLPSTHFIPTTQLVEVKKERLTSEPRPTVVQVSKPSAEAKERSTPESNQRLALVSESPVKSPVEVDESAEASQEILAAAVMGTLDHMGEQSSIRAASPMPDSPGLQVPTPEKPVKLLAIPKNIPISKYSLRPPADPHFKTDPVTRSSSPQPSRAVTEPVTHNQSFVAPTTRLQAAPATPNSHIKKTTAKSNSSSKIVPAQTKGNRKIRGPKPELRIVAPKPAVAIDTINSTLSPIEVTVARQVSLSRKQSKSLLIPPPPRRLGGFSEDDEEKVVNTQALMPVIVDANKAHRPGKSLALIIENA
jgi:hypothetical protein